MTPAEHDAYVRECCDPRPQMPPWFTAVFAMLCLVAALLLQLVGTQ